MMYGYDLGPQGWLFMVAMMTVMTVLTVIAVVAIVRAVRTGRTQHAAGSVLDDRYARGELSSHEYRERKRQLDQQ